MVKVGDEFNLVYPHPSQEETETRRVEVVVAEADSFDVEDWHSGEIWTVFQSELERGVVRIEPLSDDAKFESLTVDVHFDEFEMVDVPDYASMNMQQLREEFNRVKDVLADAGHMFVQHTDEEKDLRTQYDALLWEMKKRMEK